jgi:transcriptional regulator with XRE-family HTH domain
VAAPYRYHSARRAFESDAEMAEALGVNRSNITRWKQGKTSPKDAELLVMLDVVVTLLTGFLEPETIPKWIGGFNAHLGHRRPIQVLRLGRLSEVIRAIEAEKAGAFA